MDRETALKQLKDIRQEIVEIHDVFYECKYYSQKIQDLRNEKDNPKGPKLSLKPENTAEQLKMSYLAGNARYYREDRPGVLAVKIVHALIQALIIVLLVLDGRSDLGFIANDPDTTLSFAVFHSLVTALIVALVFAREGITDFVFDSGALRVIVCFGAALMLLICDLAAIIVTNGWIYAILTAVCVALALIAIGVVILVNRGKAKNPPLTHGQKKEYVAACQRDELAKQENAAIRAQAKAEWNRNRAVRLPAIERQLKGFIEKFNDCTEKANIHMQRLSAMDALSEDDKNLQVVDLLIRFIETRRADSIKEALQEYDKLMANQQLLEIEKKKLEAQLIRIDQERKSQDKMLEEQRRHQSEMEYWARDNARNTSKMLEEQRHHQSEMEYWARDSARNRKNQLQELQQIGTMIYYDFHTHN